MILCLSVIISPGFNSILELNLLTLTKVLFLMAPEWANDKVQRGIVSMMI